MKFITDRVNFGTKALSFEELAKKASTPARTLEELIAEAKAAKTPIVKTASVEQPVKVASVETPAKEPAPEVKAEAKPVTATVKVDAKLAKTAEKAVKKATLSMKWAKTIDFRDWTARQVVDAWEQHGSFDKCVANVAKTASHPEQYCGLLRTAAGMAKKVVTASAKPKAAAQPVQYVKFAKLSPKQKTLVREYFSQYYPADYVNAMIGDY